MDFDLKGMKFYFPDLEILFVKNESEIGFDGLMLKTTHSRIYKDLLGLGFDYDQCFGVANKIVNKFIDDACKMSNIYLNAKFEFRLNSKVEYDFQKELEYIRS